jgi:excisionase family DNA binding protein
MLHMLHEVEQVSTHIAPAKLLLTVEEAAEAMSLGRTLMYQLIKDRQVRSIKVGRTRRIPTAALHEYVRRLSELENGV